MSNEQISPEEQERLGRILYDEMRSIAGNHWVPWAKTNAQTLWAAGAAAVAVAAIEPWIRRVEKMQGELRQMQGELDDLQADYGETCAELARTRRWGRVS